MVKNLIGNMILLSSNSLRRCKKHAMKLIPELVGKPGGGAFLAGGGIQGVGPGDGGNPAAWAGLGQAGQQHDFAQNFDLSW
jgi:hypothetical protein